MIGRLHRLAPWALVALGLLVWLGPSLPGYERLERTLGEEPILRFAVGILCFYVLVLEAGRRHVQAGYRRLVESLRQVVGTGRGTAAAEDAARRQAVEVLVGALESRDPSVRRTALEHLERLTGEKLGEDPAAWRAWLGRVGRADDREES